ncbi:MAG: chromosome segregation protein [Pseudonocardiaceae bacterium]
MGHVDDRELIPLRPAFDIVRRGYDRAQVDDRIDELQANLRIVTADSEAGAAQAAELSWQLEAARQELDEARRELRLLSRPPDTVEGLSPRLKRMLRLAQDEATEIKTKAEAAAAERMAEAERNASGLRTRYEEMIADTKRRRSEMEAEHEGVITQAKQEAAETLAQAKKQAADTVAQAKKQAGETTAQATKQSAETLARARQLAAKLNAESAAKRKQVEEDFDITMSARRSEVTRVLAEEEATSKIEAQRRVDEASDVARRVVTDADQRSTAMINEAAQRVENLRTLRHQVAEQLRSVSATIDNAFQHLAPLPEEASTLAGDKPGPARPTGDYRNPAGATLRQLR